MSEQIDYEKYVADIFEDSGFEIIWTKGISFKDKNEDELLQIDVFAFYKKICILIEVTSTPDSSRISNKISRFKDSSNLLINNHDINEYFKQLRENGIKIPDRKFYHKDIKFKRLFVAPNFENDTIPIGRKEDVETWDKEVFMYFDLLSKTINEYARYDLFSYFKITPNELEGNEDAIQPRNAQGLKFSLMDNGDEIITFLASPKEMLKMARVLRRDSYNPDSYQRLLDKKRLFKIREFIIEKKNYFPNNILVSISNPPNDFVVFENKKINFSDDFEQFYIIDGQHRLFAYALDSTAKHFKKYKFSDKPTEKQKQRFKELTENDSAIKKLSEEKSLIITVLNFRQISKEQRLKKEAQTFVDVNFNQVKVKTELIYDIAWEVLESRMPEAFGTVILKKLNQKGVFKDKFKKRSYEKNKLSYVSFIKSGLKNLVVIDDEQPGTLYKYSSDNIKGKIKGDEYQEFIEYCVKTVELYFKVIKEVYCKSDDMWNPTELDRYKLLSSTSLTGFAKLLKHFLNHYEGNINEQKVKNILSKIIFDFSVSGWEYTSASQWSQFEKDFIRRIKKYKDKEGNRPFEDFGD